jgi:hypothetical protein
MRAMFLDILWATRENTCGSFHSISFSLSPHVNMDDFEKMSDENLEYCRSLDGPEK